MAFNTIDEISSLNFLLIYDVCINAFETVWILNVQTVKANRAFGDACGVVVRY